MATIKDVLETFKPLDSIFPKMDAPSFEMPEIKFTTEEEKNEYQPAILAILYGGTQISVDRLTQESFHGIRVEGNIKGAPCVVLAHQASVQMLCFAEKIENEEDKKRIGFIIDGKELSE